MATGNTPLQVRIHPRDTLAQAHAHPPSNQASAHVVNNKVLAYEHTSVRRPSSVMVLSTLTYVNPPPPRTSERDEEDPRTRLNNKKKSKSRLIRKKKRGLEKARVRARARQDDRDHDHGTWIPPHLISPALKTVLPSQPTVNSAEPVSHPETPAPPRPATGDPTNSVVPPHRPPPWGIVVTGTPNYSSVPLVVARSPQRRSRQCLR